MQLVLRFSGGTRADFGNHDYEGILGSALARFSHRLKQAYLYVEDVNGPRGGIDKQCRCVLHLRRMPPVVIQDQDESMTSLLYRVANRASYALSQKVDRRQQRQQRPRSTPVVDVVETQDD
jgi:putative sigma-54 modulation protein